MHDIEYKAQRIEAQKLQLANDSSRVYEDYLNALDARQINAKVIGSDGAIKSIPLTGDRILDYNELMNQYAMTTSTGKTLISQELHNNYNSTNTLYEFLESYGLAIKSSHTEPHNPQREPNPAYEQAVASYEYDHNAWEIRKRNYETDYANLGSCR